MRISDWSSDVCSSDLIPTGVIVNEDEARGVMFHRPAKDWPRINYELVHRSALHLLIGNQPANAIQKEDTEGFILERAHRGNQMPQQLLVAWIDYSLSQFQIGREHVCTPVTTAHLVCRI